MAKQKILVQDIADSLHLSRTTVSKVLNGSTNVSEKNRKLVLQKAAELNYKQFAFIPSENAVSFEESSSIKNECVPGNIAFLFHKLPDKQHIASSLLATLEQEISKEGYTLSLYTVHNDDLKNLKLPNTFVTENIDAILCAELFDKKYCKMLCSLNKPLLFVDSYYTFAKDNLNADILLMESKYSLSDMVRRLITSNRLKNIGFVGAFKHCLSFYERWTGFCMALQDCGLPLNKSSCIISQDDLIYWDSFWLINQIKLLDPFPELLVCANDSLAIQLISCLKELNISVPDRIMVTGFDNSPASSIVTPPLTTVNSHSSNMGVSAARQLLNRISTPTLPYVGIYLQTEILFRESANFKAIRSENI